MNLPENLFLKQLEIGSMANFVYFVGDKDTKEVLIVDPSADAPFILKEAQDNELKIVGIFLTHGHYDHVGALDELIAELNVPVYISKFEADIYRPNGINYSDIVDKDIITVGKIDFECIHTPGHTPGCTCLRYKNVLLTGDVLFVNACGRCDLPGGDAALMYDSLYSKILKLPSSVIIFPGHGYGRLTSDTLENQKRTNPYLRCKDKDEFMTDRM